MNIEPLKNFDHPALTLARDELRAAHELYTSTISTKGMALSLETAALVRVLCDELQPRSLLDLGSGFSSYVLRSWFEARWSIGKMCDVTSVDDDPNWLEPSRRFCDENWAPTQDFVTWDEFKSTDRKFDLIVYDLGRMQVRNENIEVAVDMLAPNGVVIIDDMHKFNYAKEVRRVLNACGMVGVDMRSSTTDAHEGRHCWVAWDANAKF